MIALAVVVVWSVVVLSSASGGARRRILGHARSSERSPTCAPPWLTDALKAVDRVLSGWATSIVAYALMAALIVLRRWRHLFTFFVACSR